MNKKYIVGNWKMNQSIEEIKSFLKEVAKNKERLFDGAWIAPQNLHIGYIGYLIEEYGIQNLKIGAQNSHHETSGAFTGESSPKALVDMCAHFTLIGHSERRVQFGESNELLSKKIKAALESGLKIIYCVGETLEEREDGKMLSVLKAQLTNALADVKGITKENFIVAYEPVWAIGTGKTATPEEANAAHEFIRETLTNNLNLADISLLYGGSVKPANIVELLAQKNIDGALVGGASLKAEDFLALCDAANN